MRLTVTEIIRRGFDSMLANWPLLLIRVAEGVVFVVITLVAVVAAVVPLVISLGIRAFDPKSPEDVAEFVLSIFTGHWLVIGYILGIVLLLLLVFVAIHSFVEAGSTRVYVDAERAVRGMVTPSRAQLNTFTVDRWLEGGRRKWWSVFWVYNIAWGVAGLVMLAPMLLVLLVMLLVRDSQGALIATGCLGSIVSLFFVIVVAVVTNIWSRKAIVLCVARIHQASDALAAAWGEFKLDVARHVGVTLILFILTLVGTGVLSTFSMAFHWNSSPGFNMAILPLQMIGSLLNTIFSAAMGSWFMAAFAALTVGTER